MIVGLRGCGEAGISVQEACDAVARPDCGAISTFCGTTRNYCSSRGLAVSRLDYHAYEPMALAEMRRIGNEIVRTFDVKRIAMFHRLGPVGVGQCSVVIAVSACHRHPSLSAVTRAIDQLKSRVPIWKREHYISQQSPPQWLQNAECFWLPTGEPGPPAGSSEPDTGIPIGDTDKSGNQRGEIYDQ